MSADVFPHGAAAELSDNGTHYVVSYYYDDGVRLGVFGVGEEEGQVFALFGGVGWRFIPDGRQLVRLGFQAAYGERAPELLARLPE